MRGDARLTLDRRTLLGAALLAGLPAGALADETQPAGPPTLEELMRRPVVLDAALSPDGERVALLHEVPQPRPKGGEDRLAQVGISKVSEVNDPNAKGIEVTVGDYQVRQVSWASNDRLLIWVKLGSDISMIVNGQPILLMAGVQRVLAIDADGKNPVVLVANADPKFLKVRDLDNIVDLLPDDPDHVIMQIAVNDRWTLQRVDVHTGVPTLIETGAPATDGWFLQNGVPVLRFDSNFSGTVATVYARPPGATEWTRFRRFRRNELQKLSDFDVVGATGEPGILLVASQLPEDSAVVVRRFDLRTLTPGEIVAQHPNRDIADVFQDRAGNLIGARYVEDRFAYDFADPSLAPHYRALNAFYDNQCNLRLYEANSDHSRMILSVSGPQLPGGFCLYDRKAKHVEDLGEGRPWLEGRLAPMEVLKVKARDGLDLTAYLTVPITPARSPRPMVVMPHGGPEVRDRYDFDPWAQALAARGWLVLQPNFRGSSGYGRAFAEAGHHHWGDTMQWDIEDCVKAVVAAGRADPGRLAIMGASYGGYAALMGAVLSPDLYRCAISRAGDSDLELLLNFSRREDGWDSPEYAWWRKLVGDPKDDEVMLQTASPVRRVAEIKVPLLLYHGALDNIVTVEASRRMEKAMKKAGKACTYVEIANAGHRNWTDDQDRRFLTDSIDFIARYFAG